MNVTLINPLFAAAREICQGMLKIPVTAGKPRLVRADERLWKLYQISALLRLSDGIKGVAAISFAERVALALASELAGEPLLCVNQECKDALAEVANRIVNSARQHLPAGLVMSPPKLALTSMLEFTFNAPTILVPFDASLGRFAVHVTFAANPKKVPAR